MFYILHMWSININTMVQTYCVYAHDYLLYRDIVTTQTHRHYCVNILYLTSYPLVLYTIFFIYIYFFLHLFLNFH
jgi:hypothetical protein